MEEIKYDNLRRSIRKDIFDLVKKINRTNSRGLYNILEDDIIGYQLLGLVLNIDTDDIIEKIYNLPSLNNLNLINKHYKCCCDNLDFDVKTCENILNIYNCSNYYNGNFNNYQKKLNKNDCYSLVFDFFDNYNKKLLPNLSYMIKNERIIFVKHIDRISDGSFVCSNYKFSPYILVETKENIVDATTIVHEMGHMEHLEKINKCRYRNYQNCTFNSTYEVVPYVRQLAFFDYLKNIDFNSDDVLTLKRQLIKVLLEYLILMDDYLFNFNKREFKDNYDNYDLIYTYARGILLAYEYHDIYVNDKEFFDYSIEKFITESGNYDFLSLLKICGLNREHLENGEAIKKYIKQIF